MTTKEKKPTLTGQRIRSRKRDEKIKFEPEVFRDELVGKLSELDTLEKAARFLDTAGSTLDYRRYPEPLFDVLIAGGTLAPGGDLEGEKHWNLCAFSATTNEQIKDYALLFQRLVRRYKYLQVALETELCKVLMFLRAFTPSNTEKLAKLLVQLISLGLVSAKPLESLLSDTMTKDGIALKFFVVFAQSWLADMPVKSLATALRRSALDTRIMEFFPATMRTPEKFVSHFTEAGGLEEFLKWHSSQQTSDLKNQLQTDVCEYIKSDNVAGAIAKAKEMMEAHDMSDVEIIGYIWQAIMEAVEWNKKTDMAADFALRHVKANYKVLAACCKTHNAQVVLLTKIQNYCYENQQFMEIFQKLALLLYKAEVIGEDAVYEWYSRAHSSRGKSVFLDQMKKMVEWLKSAEEESSSDEEDDDKE